MRVQTENKPTARVREANENEKLECVTGDIKRIARLSRTAIFHAFYAFEN